MRRWRPLVAELNQTYGLNRSPVPGLVPTVDYSARFAKVVNEGAGTYTFSMFHDDGARVLIDGELVFNAWVDSAGTTEKTFSVQLDGGDHTVVVEYFQAAGGAKLILDYEVVSGCAASGWSATYFAGKELQGAPLAAACVAELNQTYGLNRSPVPGLVPTVDYSARFAKVVNEGAGTYTFSMFHDDGARVLIDGELVFNAWVNYPGRRRRRSVCSWMGAITPSWSSTTRRGWRRLILDYEVIAGCAASEWSATYLRQ